MVRGAGAIGQNVQSSKRTGSPIVKTPPEPVIAMLSRVLRGLLIAALPVLMSGCNMVVLSPSGDIARQQGHLVIASTVLMLLIIVPVMALTALFAWRYRASNKQAKYEPDWDHSTSLELVIWSAPLLIIIALGAVTWTSTHKLDPYRPVEQIDQARALKPGTKFGVYQALSTRAGGEVISSDAY